MDKPEPAHVCGTRSDETATRRIEIVLNLKQLVEGWISVATLYGRTTVELFGPHRQADGGVLCNAQQATQHWLGRGATEVSSTFSSQRSRGLRVGRTYDWRLAREAG